MLLMKLKHILRIQLSMMVIRYQHFVDPSGTDIGSLKQCLGSIGHRQKQWIFCTNNMVKKNMAIRLLLVYQINNLHM